MLVTITTDASFHPTLKDGAYAFLAVCDDFKIAKSGIFKDKCINPDDAEARCIINALKTVLSSHCGISRIIINSDSLNGMALIKNDKPHILKHIGKNYGRWKHIRIAFNDVMRLNKTRAELIFRHVKAHSNIEDKRSRANEWCDTEAKKQLRKAKAN